MDALSSAEDAGWLFLPSLRLRLLAHRSHAFSQEQAKETYVKRFISAVGVLFILGIAAPVFALSEVARDSTRADHSARRPVIIDDVIRMSQSGVDDASIIAYVQKYRDRFEITADDVIALNDAKVSRDVVKALVNESRRDDRRDGRTTTTRVYVEPYWGYPYGYYDPFWYGWGPRVSIGIGFGHFRHFHHGRW